MFIYLSFVFPSFCISRTRKQCLFVCLLIRLNIRRCRRCFFLPTARATYEERTIVPRVAIELLLLLLFCIGDQVNLRTKMFV